MKIAEMMVEIGADISGFERSTRQVERDFRKMGTSVRDMANSTGDSVRGLSGKWRLMSDEMKNAYREANRALIPFKKDLMGVEYDYFKLSKSMKGYQGTTKNFMGEVSKLGKQHKTITENMMKNNELMKASFIKSVGTMLNRSGQSEKIAANFDRMNNPLYKVNNGLLGISNSLERVARNGNASVLALKMLGPTANMKELKDMTRMINQGLMRFTMVAIAAAAGAAIFYSALFKKASGPTPASVLEQQNEALAEYTDQLRDRTTEIANAWSIFENIEIKSPSIKTLTNNLEEQVRELRNWKDNLADIAKEAGSDFANYLSEMGPQAAGEVATIAKMTGPELDKYVELWKEKMGLAREQAETELSTLKKQTEKRVKELQETLTPLGIALEPMKAALAGMVQPMIELFGQLMAPIANVITYVANLVNKFNEAHPFIAKVIAAFLLLIPILTLILSPLAIGIGLFGGLQAAMSAVWMIIGPLVVGFASMMGTVLLVAAAIAGVGAALYLLWTKTSWFKEAVLAGWEAIKAGTQVAWDFILNSVLIPVWNAIVAFGQEMMAKFQAFWAEHGEQIKSLVVGYMKGVWDTIQMYMQIIQGVFQAIWPIIVGIVKIAWNSIKQLINSAIDVILGIISAGMAVMEGDWEGAWEAIKGIAEDIWGNIEAFFEAVDLFDIGKDIIRGLVDGIGSMASAVSEKVASIASMIPDGIKGFLGIHSPSRLMRDEVGKWIPAGIAVGINQNSGVVEDAAESIGKKAIPSVSDMTMGINAQGTYTNANVRPSEATANSGTSTYNFRGMLEGAVFHIREEADVAKVSRQLEKMAKAKARQNGVVFQ